MSHQRTIIGWKEWVSLPELGIPLLIAKSDTGAKTSALHAFQLEEIETEQGLMLRFGLHPNRKQTHQEQFCTASVIDQRRVINSGGMQEQRYVIRTQICLGQHAWSIDLTLTNRETMSYRMLLGREAMRSGKLLVDPAHSYLLGKPQAIKENPDAYRHSVP